MGLNHHIFSEFATGFGHDICCIQLGNITLTIIFGYIIRNIPYERYYANWDKYRRSAGPIRNWEMALQGTHLLAFYNGSSGTSSMIYYAKRHDLNITTINI